MDALRALRDARRDQNDTGTAGSGALDDAIRELFVLPDTRNPATRSWHRRRREKQFMRHFAVPEKHSHSGIHFLVLSHCVGHFFSRLNCHHGLRGTKTKGGKAWLQKVFGARS